MAHYMSEPSRTFSEYLLIPGYTSEECIPSNVSLRTPLTKYRKGVEEPAISLNIPLVSAVMQSVSNDSLAIALAKEGGLSFIFGSQSIESQAAMVAKVKNYKAGFVVSASNLTPDQTLADVLALKEKNGFSTMAAWFSMVWEPKMKLMPPSLARAMARVSLETDCMMAEVMGIFRQIAGSSWPLRYLVKGVRKDTRSGMQSSEE